jgi:glycosyltransferase involved in cell wall biosynthesis
MKILVNAVAARMGGAATYLRHFLRLAAREGEHRYVVLTSSGVQVGGAAVDRMEFGPEFKNPIRRFAFDQLEIPRLCAQLGCDALLSTNNFGSLVSPVRQVLLVRNPIFFSLLFLKRLARYGNSKKRAESFLRRNLILQSIMAADASVFPTHAMLDEVSGWASLPRDRCHVIPHGFDAADFRRRAREHRAIFAARMRPRTFNVCFVSHYAPHKNLAFLCRGFSLARQRQPPSASPLHLWLTADIARRQSEGAVWPEDLTAFRALAAEDGVTDLGTVPHEEVAGLYAASDAMIFPSLAESFGHPLKEAMSVDLPILAADIPIHREICGESATYFDPLDSDALADALCEMAGNRSARSQPDPARFAFSWEDHVRALTGLLSS